MVLHHGHYRVRKKTNALSIYKLFRIFSTYDLNLRIEYVFHIFYLGLIKQAPFHSGISRNEDMSNQNFKDSKDNTSRRHWGNAIRKLFYNSNGASLMIEEGSNPIIFSLNDPHHDGLCIGTR